MTKYKINCPTKCAKLKYSQNIGITMKANFKGLMKRGQLAPGSLIQMILSFVIGAIIMLILFYITSGIAVQVDIASGNNSNVTYAANQGTSALSTLKLGFIGPILFVISFVFIILWTSLHRNYGEASGKV
jgi:hypothetical protein